MRRRRILFVGIGGGLLIAVLLAALLRPEPEILYEVTFLPTLNGVSVTPCAINDHGQVVGVAEVTRNQWHMLLWDPEAGIRDLGPCADPRRFECVQINDAGQIAGTAADPNGSNPAFLQDPNGARCILRAPSGEQVYIHDLNNRGQVVGCYHPERGPRQAFVWDQATGLQPLRAPGGLESVARSINDAGQIVGFFSVRGVNQWYTCLWDPNAGIQNLGPAQFGPALTCHINRQGFVVGQFGSAEDQTWISTWTRKEGVQRVDAQGVSMQVTSLDDAGRFVARAEWTTFKVLGSGSSHRTASCLWDPNDGWREIHRHLGRRDVVEFEAVDLNNNGQIPGLLLLEKQPTAFGVVLTPVKETPGAED